MAEKKLALNIHDGTEFFTHETSINFSPGQIILDFKCITPRLDPRMGKDPVVVIRHNVVMMTPQHAKQLSDLLSKIIQKYEKTYGEIEPVKLPKRKRKKKQDSEAPTYFG